MPPSDAGQSWNPEGYAHHAGFVAVLGRPVLELLAPLADERILGLGLDLGCGDGDGGRRLRRLARISPRTSTIGRSHKRTRRRCHALPKPRDGRANRYLLH